MPHNAQAPQHNPAQLLDNQLCFALYSASLAMTKLYKPMLERLGLTYPQYLVMLVLWESDGASVSSLGERLARKRSSEDERRVHVWLSPTGRHLQTQAAHIPNCILTHSGMAFGELAALKGRVQRLRDALQGPGPLLPI